MTGDAQYQFEVAMGLNQASANRTVSQAARAAQEIARETSAALSQGMSSARVTGSDPLGLDPQVARRKAREFAAAAQTVINEEMARGNTGVLRPQDQRLVDLLAGGGQGQLFSKIADAQIKLANARLNQAKVSAIANLPYGAGPATQRLPAEYGSLTFESRGFKDQTQEQIARQNADRAVRSAQGTVHDAEAAVANQLIKAGQAEVAARQKATDAIFQGVFSEQRASKRLDVQLDRLDQARQREVDAVFGDVRATQAASRKLSTFFERQDRARTGQLDSVFAETRANQTASRKLSTFFDRQDRARTGQIDSILAETRSSQTASRKLGKFFDDLNAARQRQQEGLGASMALDVRTGARRAQTEAATNALTSPLPYPGAVGDLSARGKLQDAVNTTTQRSIAAQARLTELANQQGLTLRQATSARMEANNSTRALATAERNLASYDNGLRTQAATTQAGSGGGGGFFNQFNTGFKGRSDRPFSEQLGQAFKFSVFYGTAYRALSAITQTFQQTLQEGIAFQQAVSELRIATGQSASSAKDLAEEVGKEATQYGFSASEGVQIASRAQGIYGTTTDDKAIQDQVAKTSTRVVSQLAFASGLQPADLQANLGAVAQAYGLGPESQQYIGDLDAYFSKRFGAAPGSTIAATSQAATVGRAAGFSAAEVSAIAADIMARTGSTADSTGGYLAQIFSRSGEGSLNTLLGRYNINTGGSLQQQIAALAQVYKAQPDQRDDISAAFGRGKVQNAVIALLQDYGEVQDSVKDSDKVTGALGRSTEMRFDNIGGQLQVIVGDMKLFANELSDSGLLDFVGGAAVAFKNILEIVNDTLGAFNQLPRGVRDAIIALGLLTAATRVAAASEGAQSAGGLVGLLSRGRTLGGARFIGPGLEGGAIQAGTRTVTTSSGSLVPLASRAGLGAAGAGLAGAAAVGSVLALVAGGAVAFDKSYRAAKALDDARTKYLNFVAGNDFDLTTPEGYRAAASSAADVEQAQRDAADPGGLKGLFVFGDDKKLAEARAESARQAKNYYLTQADLLDQRAATGGVTPTRNGGGTFIEDLSDTGISNAFSAIAAQGGTARDQLDALTASILGTGDAAKRAAESFRPDIAGAKAGSNLRAAFIAKPGFKSVDFGQGALAGTSEDTTNADAKALFTDKQLGKAFTSALSGINPADLNDPTKSQAVIDAFIKNVGVGSSITRANDDGAHIIDFGEIEASLRAKAADQLNSILESFGNIDEVKTVSDATATLFSQQVLSKVSDELGAKGETDYNGRAGILRRRIEKVREVIAKNPNGATHQNTLDISQLLDQQAQNQIDQLEAQRAAAQRNATSQSQVAAIGRQFAGREIHAAVKNKSGDQLARVIASTGTYARDVARQAILDAQKIAVAAAEAKKAQEAVASTLAGGDFFRASVAALSSVFTADDLKKVTAPYRRLLRTLDETASADPGSDSVQGDSQADIAAARAQADAARVGGDLANARAQITSATAAMNAAKDGSVAFYNAQAQLYQAQQSLVAAQIAFNKNRYLLGHDATDPLIQARAEARAAAAQLRADTARGAGEDVIAADKVNSQSAQANVESTAFSQRLEAVQTADDLGRISHQKYLNYLQHEHDRLEGIKNRTFQQQQQLNQIDQLMQQAAQEMSGQFNFGDIKLPSPYEVRRKIAEEAAAVKNPAGQRGPDPTLGGIGGPLLANVPSTTYITIDGADTAKVKAILTDVLGKRATTTTTSPRHR